MRSRELLPGAFVALVACGGAEPLVRHQAGERLIALGGGIDLALDPTVAERHVQHRREGNRLELHFSEDWGDGLYARIDLTAEEVTPDRATATTRAFQPADAEVRPRFADGAWTTDGGRRGGLYHPRFSSPTDWHDIAEAPPTYLWTIALLRGTTLVMATYAIPAAPVSEDLDPDEIVRRGRDRFGPRLRTRWSAFRAAR